VPKYRKQTRKSQGDPVLSVFHPLKHFGAISEKMEVGLKDYLKAKEDKEEGAGQIKLKY